MVLDEIRKAVIDMSLLIVEQCKRHTLLKNDIRNLHKGYQAQQKILDVKESI
jgi:hypothetical protein